MPGRRILLIIPDTRFRALALAQLQEAGYEMVAVPRLHHALALLRSGASFELVAVDLFGVREREGDLHDLRRQAGCPILVMVGAAELPRCQALGFTEVLARPFTVGQLVARAAGLLAQDQEGGSRREPARE